jgi:cytochrome c2
MRLLADRSPIVEARAGDVEYKARGVPTNRPGYYTATLQVPSAGSWTVTIKSGFGPSNVTLLPIAAVSSAGRTPVILAESERGHRLFVAKGCLSCHTHARVADSGKYNVGPNLTNRGLDRAYLAKFLADPSVKTSWTSDARMPDLDLNDGEIAALIAFLNAK